MTAGQGRELANGWN